MTTLASILTDGSEPTVADCVVDVLQRAFAHAAPHRKEATEYTHFCRFIVEADKSHDPGKLLIRRVLGAPLNAEIHDLARKVLHKILETTRRTEARGNQAKARASLRAVMCDVVLHRYRADVYPITELPENTVTTPIMELVPAESTLRYMQAVLCDPDAQEATEFLSSVIYRTLRNGLIGVHSMAYTLSNVDKVYRKLMKS